MGIKRALLLAALLSFTAAAQALPGSLKILPISDETYALMDFLYLMEGQGRPSSSRPWSTAEAASILRKIDRSSLNPENVALWDKIESSLRREKVANLSLEGNFEAYWHANTGFNQEADWLYGFTDRKPLAKIAGDLELEKILYLYCDIQYGRNRFNIADDLQLVTTAYPSGVGAVVAPGDSSALMALDSSIYAKPFLTNILEKAVDFDYQWPKRAVASFGGEGWNLSLARDKLLWGNGRIGNFIVDSHVD